ncbi:hypothetical protein [Neorhizobium sp. T6_25]|uniref:hypothetical protein n=1 Tax=Neorhizobium sp. T6_25 TaxID=2093833 RepID=UPI001FE1DD20|nr:hypothetical protein [Neorhizobium sp. T6_25]
MNEFAIGYMPVAGGFIAWFRKVHKCDNEILKGKGGHPIIYETKAEAKAAAGEAIVAYINGPLVRDGAVVEAQSAADAVFNGLKPFIRQRGSKRRTEVERRERA